MPSLPKTPEIVDSRTRAYFKVLLTRKSVKKQANGIYWCELCVLNNVQPTVFAANERLHITAVNHVYMVHPIDYKYMRKDASLLEHWDKEMYKLQLKRRLEQILEQ